MRRISIVVIALAVIAKAVFAQGYDIYGGGDQSTQTIAHCGFLPTQKTIYTDYSVLNTRIVQHKLKMLGYYHGPLTGLYTADSKRAVMHFQTDSGLKPDGLVGPLTAQRLAYEAHPSVNVQRCWREANAQFR